MEMMCLYNIDSMSYTTSQYTPFPQSSLGTFFDWKYLNCLSHRWTHNLITNMMSAFWCVTTSLYAWGSSVSTYSLLHACKLQLQRWIFFVGYSGCPLIAPGFLVCTRFSSVQMLHYQFQYNKISYNLSHL